MSTHDISPSRVTREDKADQFAANVLRYSLAIPPEDRVGDLNLVVLLAPRTPAMSNSCLGLTGMNLSGHCLCFQMLQVVPSFLPNCLVLAGFQAFWRSGVPALQHSRVSAFPRCCVAAFQRSRVAAFPRSRVPAFQRFQRSRVPAFPPSRVPVPDVVVARTRRGEGGRGGGGTALMTNVYLCEPQRMARSAASRSAFGLYLSLRMISQHLTWPVFRGDAIVALVLRARTVPVLISNKTKSDRFLRCTAQRLECCCSPSAGFPSQSLLGFQRQRLFFPPICLYVSFWLGFQRQRLSIRRLSIRRLSISCSPSAGFLLGPFISP